MTDILSTNDSLFTKNDMIMTDNGYYASMPIIHTVGEDTVGGNKPHATDKVSDNYKNLAIPALYLYTINGSCYNQNNIEDPNDIEEFNANEIMLSDEIMPDDLYNKLISLAEMKPLVNKKYTRNKKNMNKQNMNKQNVKNSKGKKTRRNK